MSFAQHAFKGCVVIEFLKQRQPRCGGDAACHNATVPSSDMSNKMSCVHFSFLWLLGCTQIFDSPIRHFPISLVIWLKNNVKQWRS